MKQILSGINRGTKSTLRILLFLRDILGVLFSLFDFVRNHARRSFVFALILVAILTPVLYTRSVQHVAKAAPNDTVNFQARLLTNTGALVPDGNYNVEFKIYNAASGGTLHWTETRTGGNTVTIKNGYLSVALGSVNAFSNASPAIDWSNGNYLTMNIGGIGTPSWNGEMSPRILITSVPYAFRAAEASQIKTVNGSNVSSLSILAPTGGNQVFQIQDQGSAGTYNLCIQNSSSCGYALLGGANTFTGVNTFSSAGTALQVTNNATIGGTLGVTGLTTATGGLTTGNNSLFTNGGATLNNTLAIGNKDYSGSGNTGTIGTAATTVDIYTNFTIAQTTAGQTLTIPSPTSTTTGRLIYITNIGSAGYTMAGAVVSPGVTMQFVWNNTTSSWSLVTSGVSGSYIQNGTALQTANFNIQSNAVGSVTATIQGANSQTANILEVKASGVSNPLLSISPTGATVFQNSSDSTTALQVKNSAGTNTVLDVNTTNGRVGIGTTSPSNTLEVSRASSVVSDTQLTVTNSTSGGYGAGVLFSGKRSDDGLIYSQAKITADGDQNWSSAATQSSSLRFFTIQGGTLSEKMRISAGGTLAVNSTTFGTNNKLIVNPYSTVDNLATAQINTNATTNKGLVVQGYAGQTADLLQLQNSAGTVLSAFDSAGKLAINTTSTTSALTVKGTSSVATVGVTNLLTADGTFATDTGWTIGAGWTTGGQAAHATGNTATLSGTSTATATNVVYQVNFTVTQTTVGAGFGVSLGGADSGTTINTAGAKTLYIRPTSATGTLIFTPLGTGDWVGTIDDVTVYPVNVSTPEISVVGSNGASTPIEVRQSGSALGSLGIGTGSLKSNLVTSNTGVGTSTLMYNASGVNNTAMGAYTLMNNTSGVNNSAVGMYSMIYNTTGNNNVSLGVQSLSFNISGSNNSGVGAYSLYRNTTGNNNSAFGYSSLYNNSIGLNNSGVGAYSLFSNTTGILNSAFGYTSLYNNTSGNSNVGFGVQSLYNNISGSYNSGVGAYSLFSNTTGSENSAVGYGALYNSATSSGNVALGAYAGRYFATSSALTNPIYSTFLGYNTRASADGNTNEIVIGYNALGNGSNSVTLGSTAISKTILQGSVGVGTTTFGTNNKLIVNPYSTVDNLATAQINTNAATNKGLVIQGFAGQSANLLEAQDSTGAVLMKVDQLGGVRTDSLRNTAANGPTISLSSTSIRVSTGTSTNIPIIVQGAASQTADLLQVQDSSGNVNSSFNATGNQLTLGRVAASGTVTQGKLLFADGTTDNFAGTLQSTTLTAARTWTLPDVGGTLCTTTTCALGTGGTAIVQVPASTANNTITPTAAGVTGLTVNGTSNGTTAGTALVVTQANAVTAVDGVDINLTNTSGTLTNGLLINRNGAGGTTTNLLNLTNTAGTVTNGIVFNGTITTDITTAATRALKVVTGTTGGLTLDTGTTGQIDIGTNANTKTVNIGSATGTSITNIQGGSGTAAGDLNLYTAAGGIINIGVNSVTNKVVNIGSTGSVAQNSTINIANTNSNNAQLVRIGSTANTGSNVLIQGGAHASAISLQAAATGNILIGTVNSNNLSLNTGATTGTTTLGGTSTSGIITLGQSSGASNTINIGNVAGNTFTQTINMGNSATAGSVTNVTIGSLIGASSTNIQAGTGNLDLLTNSATASVIVQSQTNGTGAFSVKNSASTNVFNVNTTNSTVGINYNNTASTDAALSIVNTNAANSTLLLKNVNSQTGTSLDIQNPSNQSMFTVWSDGSLSVSNQGVNSAAAIQVNDMNGFTNFNINNKTGFVTINGLKDASGNILQDGGFEGGSSFTWAANEVTTGDGIYNDSTNARNGNRELKIAGSASNTDTVSQQWFAVTPGDAIYFEGYVKSISGNGDAGIYLEFRDKDKANPQYINSFTGTPGSSYGIKSINSTVPANMVYVRPVVTKRANATAGTYYFDDMYLAGTTPRAPASFRNSVNSTSAFQIQSSGGSDTLFTADTTNNTIKVGNNTGTGSNTTLFVLDNASTSVGLASVAGAMYYDTTKGHVQCYEADGWGACGSAPDNIVNLNPEYSGAVLNGTGVGTMTTDLCANGGGLTVNTGLCASGEARNLYKWTSPQATQQTYSIYVSYQLPSTFKAFADDNTVQLTGRVDNTTNAAVTYQMFRSEGGSISACGTETTVTTSANVWQTVGINGNESTGCGFTSSSGGAFVIFKINVKANSGANAYVSTLGFTTTGK